MHSQVEILEKKRIDTYKQKKVLGQFWIANKEKKPQKASLWF